MKLLKFIGYVVLINILRYFPGSFLEMATILDPMFATMEKYPDCFGFEDKDFYLSFIYNFMIWFSTVLIFHIAHKSLKGSIMIRSLIVFGICCLFFISLSAVYMNHFTQGIREFYVYSIIDGLLLFSFLGIINGWLYPKFYKQKN